MDKVLSWLSSIGLPQYHDVFENDGWDDMDVVLDMGEDDLETCGITKRGHIRKIKLAIDRLRQENIKEVDDVGDGDSSKIKEKDGDDITKTCDLPLVGLTTGTRFHDTSVSLEVEASDGDEYNGSQDSSLAADNGSQDSSLAADNGIEPVESKDHDEDILSELDTSEDDVASEARSNEDMSEERNIDVHTFKCATNANFVQPDGHTLPLCSTNNQCAQTDERTVPVCDTNDQYVQTDECTVSYKCNTNDQYVQTDECTVSYKCDTNDQNVQIDECTVPVCIQDKAPEQCTQDETSEQCIQDESPEQCIQDESPEQCIQDEAPDQCTQDETSEQCIQDEAPEHNRHCGSERKRPEVEEINPMIVTYPDSDLSDADDDSHHAFIHLPSEHAMVPHGQPLVAQTLTLACASKSTVVTGSKNVTIADTVEIHNEHESPPCIENYSDQTQTFLQTYKREARHLFVKTRCYDAAADILDAEHWVVILGNPGDGKTTIANQLMLEHRRKDYQPIMVTSVNDWKTMVEGKGNGCNKQFVVIDDIFGVHSVDNQKVNEWLPLLKFIQNVITGRGGTLKVLCTTRSYIYADIYEKVSHFTHFGQLFLVNMNATEYALTTEEKIALLDVHHKVKNIQVGRIDFKSISEKDLPFGFPLCVDMYCKDAFIRKQGEPFFSCPVHMLESELVYLSKHEKTKYCALVLVVLSPDNTVTVHEAKKENNREVKDARCIAGLSATKPIKLILDALESLKDVYVVGTEKTLYSFKHSAFKEVVSVLITRSDPKMSLIYFDVPSLVKYTRCEGYKEQKHELVAVLPKQCYKRLMYRLTIEMLCGDCSEVCWHQAWENTEFVQMWMKYATQNPETGTRTLEALTLEKPLSITSDMSFIPALINAGQVKVLVAVLDELVREGHFTTDRNKQYIESILEFTLSLYQIVLNKSDGKDIHKHSLCLSAEYYLPLLQSLQCVSQTILVCTTGLHYGVGSVVDTNLIGKECRLRYLLCRLKTNIQRLSAFRENEQDGNPEVNSGDNQVWRYCNGVLLEFRSDGNIPRYDADIEQIMYENYERTQFRRMSEHHNIV